LSSLRDELGLVLVGYKLSLWLGQNRLERGGHVFEPKVGLEKRALSKSKTTTKINDTTEPILARPALIDHVPIDEH